MLGKLIILFTIIPIIELYILIEIGNAIGALNTILIVLITGITGAFLAKLEGRQIIFKIQNDLNMGKMPTDELLGGLCVLIGGAFLIAPGILTDIAGFLLVIHFTRLIFVRAIKKKFRKFVKGGSIHFHSAGHREGSNNYERNQNIKEKDEIIDADFEELE